MNRAASALLLAALILTSACSGSDDANEATAQDTLNSTEPTESPTSTASPTATEAAGGAYELLSQRDLEAALLTIRDLPAGYSQDPPSESSTKTFCDYEVPFTEKVKVTREYSKGGGMSTELLAIGLRQFGSPDQARASFHALVDALDA